YPYDGQSMQIAAYAGAKWGPEALDRCWGANIYVSTTEPGRVDIVTYPPAMIVAEYRAFCRVCEVWRHQNQYDPRTFGVPGAKAPPKGEMKTISEPVQTEFPCVQDKPKEPLAPYLVPFEGRLLHRDCEGMDFLHPKDCLALAHKNTGSKYGWFIHPESDSAFVYPVADADQLDELCEYVLPAYPS